MPASASRDGVITLDVDWAPDVVIDSVAQILIERRAKATWFVTHASAAIERLAGHRDLFELGIHPNMLPGSTHGRTEDEVMAHMATLVPGAVTMRTHGLYQTSNFLVKAAKDYGILNDVSLFLPRAPHLQPHRINWGGAALWRIPYFWEDDSEMYEDDPIWALSDGRLQVSGLRVFDFHPIHVALNTERFARYDTLKSVRPLQSWDEQFVAEHARHGDGPRRLFIELADALAGKGQRVKDMIAAP